MSSFSDHLKFKLPKIHEKEEITVDDENDVKVHTCRLNKKSLKPFSQQIKDLRMTYRHREELDLDDADFGIIPESNDDTFDSQADPPYFGIFPMTMNQLPDLTKASSIQIIDAKLQEKLEFDEDESESKRKRNIAYSSIRSPEMSKTNTRLTTPLKGQGAKAAFLTIKPITIQTEQVDLLAAPQNSSITTLLQQHTQSHATIQQPTPEKRTSRLHRLLEDELQKQQADDRDSQRLLQHLLPPSKLSAYSPPEQQILSKQG